MLNTPYQLIRVCAAVPKTIVADTIANADAICEAVCKADDESSHIVVFPELCVSGYTCADLFFQNSLIEACKEAISHIIQATAHKKMCIIIGSPLIIDNNLYNCAIVINQGQIIGIVPKSLLPNYNEFYEKRWFCPADMLSSDSIKLCGQNVPVGTDLIFNINDNFKFGIEICEDLWSPIPPSSFLCLAGADIIFNLSASNELVSKRAYRQRLIRQQSARAICGYVYCNAGNGESTSDIVFSGHCMIAENGRILSENGFICDQDLICSDIDIERLRYDRMKQSSYADAKSSYYTPVRYISSNIDLKPDQIVYPIERRPFVPNNGPEKDERCSEIMDIQVAGLKKRLEHINCNNIIIGISGGLDSTLALLVATKAFDELGYDRKNIMGVTMPGFGTTSRTMGNAIKLMESLNTTSITISIKDACIQHFKDINHDISVHDICYENTQARERTQILMDMANKTNGIVIGTGDLSELALGWCTYNGDHISHYGVNVGVPKTLVRSLVNAYATLHDTKTKAILADIIDTPISPELLPKGDNDEIVQRTEDAVGPYELHDFFIYYMLRFGFSPSKIMALAEKAFSEKEVSDDVLYDKATILKWLKICYKRFFSQQFKRNCLPDGPKIGSIALSPRGDLRMPSDASANIWLKELNGLE